MLNTTFVTLGCLDVTGKDVPLFPTWDFSRKFWPSSRCRRWRFWHVQTLVRSRKIEIVFPLALCEADACVSWGRLCFRNDHHTQRSLTTKFQNPKIVFPFCNLRCNVASGVPRIHIRYISFRKVAPANLHPHVITRPMSSFGRWLLSNSGKQYWELEIWKEID